MNNTYKTLAATIAVSIGFVSSGLAQQVVTVVPLTNPVTSWLGSTFTPYITRQLATAESGSAAAAAGINPANDVVEKVRIINGKRVAPFHVAKATRPSQPTSGLTLDPAVEQNARATLRGRLRREPTYSEVLTEVAAFDARVQQINQALAARHADIAQAMSVNGRFPRSIERPILGLRPPDPAAGTPAANAEIERLIRLLATGPSVINIGR